MVLTLGEAGSNEAIGGELDSRLHLVDERMWNDDTE